MKGLRNKSNASSLYKLQLKRNSLKTKFKKKIKNYQSLKKSFSSENSAGRKGETSYDKRHQMGKRDKFPRPSSCFSHENMNVKTTKFQIKTWISLKMFNVKKGKRWEIPRTNCNKCQLTNCSALTVKHFQLQKQRKIVNIFNIKKLYSIFRILCARFMSFVLFILNL